VSTSTLLPTIAIERIEVVKDGSSALYGSDAVAGVVNFLTRTGFEGVELQARAATDGETGNQDDVLLGGIWGTTSDKASIVVSAEFIDRDPLTINERFSDFGRSGVSTLGNPGTFVPQGAAAGPFLVGGGAALGLGPTVPIAGDLDCEVAGGVSRQSFRSPTRGTPFAGALDGLGACIYDFSPFFSIVGEETRLLTHVDVRYDISDTMETYAEFGYSDTEFRRGNSLFPLVRFPTIPVNNPGLINDFARRSAALTGNPVALTPAPTTFFGRVLGFTPNEGPDSSLRPVDTQTREFVEDLRAVVGIRGDLPFANNWTFDFSFTHSERDAQARNTDTKQQNLQLALNGLGGPNCNIIGGTPGQNGCQFWNPFFSGFFTPEGARQTDAALINSPELLNWMVGEIRTVTESRLSVADLIVSGDVMSLPAGNLGLAFGVQLRREEVFFDADDDSNRNNFSFIFGAQDFDAKEDVLAAFIEAAIPLTSQIDLQIAGRVEDFEENDETTFDPKATLMYRVTEDLTLRGSVGTSFRVGSLLQRFGQSTQLINIADPFSGAGLAFRPQIGLGNADVTPEEATTWNVGLSWSPDDGALEGLRIDIDYYDYNYDDLITLEGPQDLVLRDQRLRCPQGLNSNPADGIPDCGRQADGRILSVGTGIPDQVIRDNNLNFLRAQPTFSNAQALDVSGLDFNIVYEWTLGMPGVLTSTLAGSWAREWDLTRADGSVIDGVGSRNFGTTIGRSLPEWKFNLGLNWVMNRHAAFALVRYIDAYNDNQLVDDPGADGQNVCLGSCLRAFSTGQSGVIGATAGDLDRRISSWTTVDAQYSYELPEFWVQKDGSRISVGGTNVFNRKPPRVNVDGLFDPFVHDPRGAVWYLRYEMVL